MGPAARGHIAIADEQRSLAVSAATFWEVAMLIRKSRLSMTRHVEEWHDNFVDLGMIIVPLSADILMQAVQLKDFHNDPADRFIVATAMNIEATLVTADRPILRWPGSLQTINAKV